MKTLSLALAATLALASGAAMAKTSKTAMHCMMPDGTMDMAMSKSACKTAKGTWTKHSATMPMGGTGAMPMPMSMSNGGSMAPMAPMPRK